MGCQTTPSGRPAQGQSPQADPVRHEILASDISFDAEEGKLHYTLPEPALVRVRIGIKEGGALLRTLVDWERREAGPHTETWDFTDASGKVSFGKRKDFLINLACLPADTEERKDYTGSIRGFRKSPKLEIIFPEARSLTEDGVPIVSGKVPVRIQLSEDDKRWVTETKFELILYIDGVFVIEDEEGLAPFTYKVDSEKINEGAHAITVNILTYEGEAGTSSALINVQPI